MNPCYDTPSSAEYLPKANQPQRSTLSLAESVASSIQPFSFPVPSLSTDVLSFLSLKSLSAQLYTNLPAKVGAPQVVHVSMCFLIKIDRLLIMFSLELLWPLSSCLILTKS
jgi:hypothetical protein